MLFSGRRRRRPLPRYRETVLFFSAKGLCEHNTGGASPSPAEIDGDRLFVRRRKIVRTMLGAINDRPYKRNSSKRRRGDSIFRFASRHTCFASMRSPVKPNGKNKQNSGAPTPTHIVGTGVLDCPFRYESKFFPRRTVEDACPYNVCGGRCAAVLFCSRRLFYAGDQWSPLRCGTKYNL